MGTRLRTHRYTGGGGQREGAEGWQNNKQQPIIDGSGKGMAAVNNYGDDDHTVAGDDDDRAPED